MNRFIGETRWLCTYCKMWGVVAATLALITAACGPTTPPQLTTTPITPPAAPASAPSATSPASILQVGKSAGEPTLDRIAFVSRRDGASEIYIVNSDGSNPTRLTNNSLAERDLVMSPDGSKIAFSAFEGKDWQIFVMNSDGSGVTNISGPAGDHRYPAWSPDGTKILFSFEGVLYVMGADGSNPTPLEAGPGINTQGAWAPDGRRIAFVKTIGTGGGEIYLMEVSGPTQVRLTNSRDDDSRPTWSPDGKRIAFQSVGEDGSHIYVINADGSEQTRLTSGGQSNQQPAWSPDGSKIIFSSNRDGLSKIFAMNADGSHVTTLINLVEGVRMGDIDPHWSHAVDPKAGFAPLPIAVTPTPDPARASNELQGILLASGIVFRDDTAQFEEWYWLENGKPSRLEPGEYAYSMLDKDGNVLEKVTYQGGFAVHVTPGGTFPIDADPFAFAIPYPEQLVTQIILSREDKIIASFEPNSKLLRDAINLTPDQGFDQSPEARKTALHREIDELEKLIEDGELAEAAQLLENNIKYNVERWRNDYESDDGLQFTKQDLLALVDDILSRLMTATVAPVWVPTPTPTTFPTTTPVPTPSPAEIALLQTAEDLALSWITASSDGDIDFLVEMAVAPFFFDNELLVNEAEIRERYSELYGKGYELPVPISEIKASAFTRRGLMTEYQRLGFNPSHDRFLSKMDFSEDDIAVRIEIRGEGLIFYFRRVGSDLKLAGFWG